MSYDFNFPVTTISNNTTASLDVKQLNIMFAPQLVYNLYYTTVFKVFLDAGIAINLSSYNDYKYHVDYYSISSTDSKSLGFSSSYFSIPVNAGFAINKKIEFNAGYIFSSSVTNYPGGAARISSINVRINYLF